MKCFYPMCIVSPQTGGTLFRINAKGQPGIWACREHRANTDAPKNRELDRIVDALERRSGPNGTPSP